MTNLLSSLVGVENAWKSCLFEDEQFKQEEEFDPDEIARRIIEKAKI